MNFMVTQDLNMFCSAVEVIANGKSEKNRSHSSALKIFELE